MGFYNYKYINDSINSARVGEKGDLPDEKYFRNPTEDEMKVIPKMYCKLLNFNPLSMIVSSVVFICLGVLLIFMLITLILGFLTRSYFDDSLVFQIFFTVVVGFLLYGSIIVSRKSWKVVRDYILMKKLLRDGNYLVMDFSMCDVSRDNFGNISFNLRSSIKDGNIIFPKVMTLSSSYIRKYEKKYNRSVEDGKYLVVKLENGYYKIMENIC